ncbi:elongin-C-like isoform X1 [Aphis craccivora]|uniref:Elongin-C n=1 Tax=Aphis craccivora TaxID=307492 RepID=A0A6G0YEF5_APHCR|nr:elongin-C-like isoform X1 [Aphis craccivora]
MEYKQKDEENPGHGGCEGPNSMYIKLTSSDEHEFIVKREHAMISSTIKAMLTGPGQFLENQVNEIRFRDIPSNILYVVCMYFAYKARYNNTTTEPPIFPISPQIARELLIAANFLDC